MNRFIRTKDGEVFELFAREKRLYGDFISIDHKHYRYDCVIKQAYRLEELCDVFIKKSKEPGNNYFCRFNIEDRSEFEININKYLEGE